MPSPRTVLAIRAAGVLAMGVFGWAVVGATTDRIAATRPLWERVVPRPFADNAWRTRALLAMQRRDPAAAVAAARAGVNSGPVEPASSELLGSALLLAGQPEAADRAFRVAGQMGWRRPATQIYWMNQAMAAGDYRNAIMRLDALLRQTPQRAGDPNIMRAFEEDAGARTELVAKLATGPSWLASYARSFDALAPAELRARGEILQGLAARGAELGCATVGPLVSILIERGMAGSAHGLWHAHCPAEAAGLAGDGNFVVTDIIRRASLFSWWSPAESDISTVVDGQAAPGQPRLLVTSGSPFAREVVNRMVYLQPGTYRLQWQAIGDDGQGTDRIVATLGCRQGAGEPLVARLEPRTGTSIANVTIGTECAAQWLSFGVTPGPEKLRFGNVRIDRAP